MNQNIWVSTDHHFGHENIIKFSGADGVPYRNFASIKDHDEYIIKCHNEVVGVDDTVIFCGDIGGDKKHLDSILPRMRGKKKLIMGNHDKHAINFYNFYFERIRSWYMFGEGGPGKIVVSHYPLMPESFHPTKPWMNVHGHTHIHLVSHKADNYYNICPEHVGYYPLSVNSLFAVARERGLFE